MVEKAEFCLTAWLSKISARNDTNNDDFYSFLCNSSALGTSVDYD